MFKFNTTNVIKKLNHMDRKQAYTWGAVGVGVIVALFLLASFLGGAEESFDGLQARGYDLANSPFVTDEAEQFLLASKYPDMKDNNANALYGPVEKEERQAQDEAEAEQAAEETASSSGYDSDDGGYSSRGYSGRGGGGPRTPTQVGQLGGAAMTRAGGTGISSTYGSPRVDTTPYQKNRFQSEKIATVGANAGNGRRSLMQFASASQAGAKLKDNKAVNQKRALQGGEVAGAGNFKEDGTVDMSNVTSDMLDTNAPQASGDLGNIDDAVAQAGEKAQQKDDENTDADRESFGEKLEDAFMEISKEMIKGTFTSWLKGETKWQQDKSQQKILTNQIKDIQNNYTRESGKTISQGVADQLNKMGIPGPDIPGRVGDDKGKWKAGDHTDILQGSDPSSLALMAGQNLFGKQGK